jgi:nucleoid-associated protein YgaU
MLFADGPAACPFVALESDRDRRSNEPDPRHRCYAEPTPAPRALAHQRQFCLSPDFGRCPIFQDWAIRAAARPVPLRPLAQPPDAVATGPDAPAGPEQLSVFAAAQAPDSAPAAAPEPSPPTPAAEDHAPARPRPTDDWPPAALPPEPALPAPETAAPSPTPAPIPADPADAPMPPFLAGRAAQLEADRPTPSRHRPLPKPSRRDEWAAQRADLIPSWERQRYSAYPTIRTRMGLGDSDALLSRLTRILAIVALIAVLLALVILAPGFFGGAPGPTPTPSPSPPPTGPTASPTAPPSPSPTFTSYTVRAGDTIFGIATRFGLLPEQILAANPEITDPNLIQVGQVIRIPPDDFALPTFTPGGVSPSVSP